MLRSGSEKKQSLRLPSEGFDRLVFFTGIGLGPFEVVRLIHDQQIPLGSNGLLEPFLRICDEPGATEDELIVQERVCVFLIGFNRLTSVFVEDIDPEIKFSQQLDEPLMHERFWDNDENSRGSTTNEKAVKDQACLDRFSEADLIR